MIRRLAAAAVLALAGCTATVSPPDTSIRAVRSASAADFPPLALGAFVPSPSLPRGADRAVGLRASTIKPPNGQSFARFLGETIEVQLRLAAKLDPAAPLVLSGELTRTSANPALGRGKGALAAIFRLTAHGRPVFEKTLSAGATWSSSVIGAVAIFNAEREYTALYPQLVETLFDDPDFRAALRAAR